MSHFEFISVAASLVLSFGALRYLSGAQSLVSGHNTYWVVSLWAAQGLLNIVIAWWMFWNYSAVENWNLGEFLLVLCAPAIYYIGACVIVPSQVSLDTEWRSHFFDAARKPLMVVAVAGSLIHGYAQFLLGGIPVPPEGIFVGLAFCAIYTTGYFFPNPRVQGGVVIANLIVLLLVLIPLVFDGSV